MDRNVRQVRILSCSGGGIRGLLSARLLEHLMARIGASIQDTFHLFAGNSTGALIGLAQVRPDPHPASAIPEFYHEFGPQIFSRSYGWKLRTAWGFRGPKYPIDGLRDCARNLAGDYWLSDCTMDFLAPAYDLVTGGPYWFKSWDAIGGHDFALADVGQASASAPTYFPASKIIARDRTIRYFSDGGVFANNPSLAAIREVRQRYPKATEILLVSIGTGSLDYRLPAERIPSWGLLSWLPPLIDILQTVNGNHLRAQVAQALEGHKYYHFDLKVSQDYRGVELPSTNMDLASAGNLARLDDLAHAWIQSSTLEIDQLAPLLASPKCDPSLLM